MKTIYNLLIAAILFIFTGLCTSCSYQEDTDWVLRNEIIKNTEWTSIDVDFTYTVPEELFRYVDITAVYNTQDFTDAEWVPMLENTFSYSYHNITKRGVFAPVVLVYEKSNRLVSGIKIDGQITMEINIVLYSGNTVIDTIHKSYVQEVRNEGDIYELIKNVHLRTFGINISKSGEIKITPDYL